MLKFIFNFTLLIILFFATRLDADLSVSDCDHKTNRTQNEFIPDFSFGLTPRALTENSAVTFLAEAGRRNFRFNGTYGLLLGFKNRLKISGEYLQQKLGYNFSSGNAKRWMHQYAVGAVYRHDFCFSLLNGIELGGYYSFAPGKHLRKNTCSDRSIFRHIAGSSGYGFLAGTVFTLWPSSILRVDLDYDIVNYHRKFKSNKHVSGFGGSFNLYQPLFYNLALDLTGEFKRPYNYYKALLAWNAPSRNGLSIGIFGSHTRGKSHLPSNTIVGLELDYIFGGNRCSDYCETSCPQECYSPSTCCEQKLCLLKAWVASPAVYIPQVLAIADERVCLFPRSTPIPNFTITAAGPFSINISQFFSNPEGGNFVFTATGLPTGATIDPETGIISGTNLQDGSVHTITVTATNRCSSTSQTFSITFVPCTAIPTSRPIPNQSFCSAAPYSFNVSGFFTDPPGGTPLVFSATGLPAGSTINSSTGVISGPNLQDNSVHSVTVTASNACGSTSQTFTISFPCTAPTSIAITPNPFVVPPTQLTYTFNISGFFTSPCGQPFTFSLSGNVPAGTVINPTTGVISGPNVMSPNPFNVTVTGTTTCGSTSQPLQLILEGGS